MPSNAVLLVIPCFRESSRILPFLKELETAFKDSPNVHVQVVDDGSGVDEATKLAELVKKRQDSWPGLRSVLALSKNRGKGGAVYAGWATATDESWLAFVDADGSCSAREVKRLLEMRSDGALFASRLKILGRSIQRCWHRHFMGRVFATMVSELLDIPVYDSQCGLKLVPRSAYEAIKNLLQVQDFSFDVELLCALLDSGCQVSEVPVDWHEVAGGKVHLLRDSWRMFRSVLSIRSRRTSQAWISACLARHSTRNAEFSAP